MSINKSNDPQEIAKNLTETGAFGGQGVTTRPPAPQDVILEKKLTKRGLPVNAHDWTEADWTDLYRATEEATRSICARHAGNTPPARTDSPPRPDCNCAARIRAEHRDIRLEPGEDEIDYLLWLVRVERANAELYERLFRVRVTVKREFTGHLVVSPTNYGTAEHPCYVPPPSAPPTTGPGANQKSVRAEKPVTEPTVSFQCEVRNLINKCCMENGSDTPDFVLAEYLIGCLAMFDKAVNHRDRWYGRKAN